MNTFTPIEFILFVIFIVVLIGVIFAAYYLKDVSTGWKKVYDIIFRASKTKPSEELEDMSAFVTIKKTCQDSVLEEQTYSCKGRDLKESLSGIQTLKQMFKEEK